MNVRQLIEKLEELAQMFGDETPVKDANEADFDDPEFVDGFIELGVISN